MKGNDFMPVRHFDPYFEDVYGRVVGLAGVVYSYACVLYVPFAIQQSVSVVLRPKETRQWEGPLGPGAPSTRRSDRHSLSAPSGKCCLEHRLFRKRKPAEQ